MNISMIMLQADVGEGEHGHLASMC